jgi:hypothetical protein
VNHKRVYRLYGEEQLALRTRRRKKRASQLRVLPARPGPVASKVRQGLRARLDLQAPPALLPLLIRRRNRTAARCSAP